MKNMLKHFFKTAFLIALVWGSMMLPINTWGDYLNPIVWGLIALVIIVTGIYLYWGYKKGFLTFVWILMILCAPSAWAYQQVNCTNETNVSIAAESCSGTGCEYYRCLVNAYKGSGSEHYCTLKKQFDPDKAIKNNTRPDENEVKNAIKYLDSYDRAATAGCVDKNGKFMEGVTLGLISDDDEDNRDCAEDYLDEVATYNKKKAELNTQTVYQILKNDRDKCWPCGLVHTMMVAVEKLALSMEDELSKAALMLLGIMFLFWLLFKVLILISQFGTANNAEFFTDLLTRFILAVIAVALLSGPMGVIYRLTFSNLLDITLQLSTEVIAQADSQKTVSASDNLSVDTNLSGIAEREGLGEKLAGSDNLECGCCTNENSDCNGGQISECRVNYTDSASYAGTGLTDDEVRMLFSKKEKQMLMCLTCKTYKETAPFVAAGRVLVYHAWKNKNLISKAAGWVEDLVGIHVVSYIPSPISMWFIGMVLIVGFTWIAYVIGFKLLDIFLRIGFIIMLTPFLVTTFVFPISRQYTKRGWDFLAHALLSIFAVSMGIALFMAVFTAALPNDIITKLNNVFSMQEIGKDQDYPVMVMDAFGAGEDGSAFYSFFIILIVCFAGINVLQGSQVIIEGLSGLTSGIPPIAGAAVVGAIRAALAPLRMAKDIIMDKIDGGGLNALKRAKKGGQDQDPNDDNPGVISHLGSFTGSQVEKAGDKAGKAAGKGTEYAIKGVGLGVEGAGKATSGIGKLFNKIPYVGAIIGVPLQVVGKSVEVGGKAIQRVAGIAGKAVEKTVKAGSRVAAKGIKKGSQKAQKIWNRTKRKVVNRIKQIPAKIKNFPKNVKKKFLKATRRTRAKRKYRQQRRSGHGPANWTRSENNSGSNRRNRNQDRDQNQRQERPNNTSEHKEETMGHRALRKTFNMIDRADEELDNGLDGVEKSFGDGDNRHLPNTDS
ncbi:MAG: hypothetical protein SPL08_04440 [Pseudomonadota bacterium]|nr:hypothetical protein [Pseudomonadota bacterium]